MEKHMMLIEKRLSNGKLVGVRFSADSYEELLKQLEEEGFI